jgi:hypothetical protein
MTEVVAPVVEPVVPVVAPVVEPVVPVVEPVVAPVVDTVVPVEVAEERHEQLSNFVTDAGFDISDVDTYLDEHGVLPQEVLDALTEKHGEAVANIIASQTEQMMDAQRVEAQAQDKKMFDHLQETFKDITEQSGEDTWNELKTWAQTNMPEQKQEVNAMLAAGGLSTKLALDHMISQFRGADDFGQPADLLAGDNFADDMKVAPLSKEAYNTQLNALLSKGHRYESPEVARLQRQRMKAMQRGM